MVLLGIAAALLGAIALALGAQFQNRGVQSLNEDGDDGTGDGFNIRQLLALVRTPRWLLGSGMFVVAVVLQLLGLLMAPIAVVQPVGALSLVVTALLNRRIAHTTMERQGVQGIAAAVAGTTVFVVVASFTTTSSPQSVARVVPVLLILIVVLALVATGFLTMRKRLPGVAFAIGGGVCFGFVATLMKIVLDRCSTAVQHGSLIDDTTPFTLLALVAAGASGLLGTYLVQTAYSSGSPDLVVAALTVVDPIVAVTVGIAVLGEAQHAPWWAFVLFVLAEGLAVFGVIRLARHQPEPVDAQSA